MNYTEFSKKIKAKYPGSYDDLDDKTLAQKMVEKYPQYSDVTFDDYGAKDYIGDIARPLLIGGGAIGGGLAGASVGGPVGAVGGGALGYGTGKAAADLLDRSLGRMAPIKNIGSAAKEVGASLKEGAEAEALGLGFKVAAPLFMKGVGKTGAQIGEWATGIPAKDFGTVARTPSSMLPGTMGRAKKLFAKAASEAGVSDEITPELLKRIKPSSAGASNYAFDAYEQILEGKQLLPKDALAARQALDAIYPLPNAKNASYIRILDKMRNTFQDVISSASPELQKASKEYAIAKGAQKFKHLFPQTTTGKPSYFRSAAVLAGLAAGKPWAAFGSPIVAGATTAGVGATRNAVNAILKNPTALRGIVASFLSSKPQSELGVINPSDNIPATNQQAYEKQKQGESINNQISKHQTSLPQKSILKKRQLDKKIAARYLDEAGGDMGKALKLAERDGY